VIAVVPAAGRGSRLGPLTVDRPKALIPVAGRPVLFWVIEGLAAAGVSEVVVVTGHLAEQVEALADRASIAVSTVRQQSPRGTADALMAAAARVAGRPFVYAWGDLVADPAGYRRVVEAWTGGAVLAVNRVADPTAGAAVTVDGAGSVTSIIEKPPPGTSSTPFNASGIGALPADAWVHLAAVAPSERGELEITSALGSMLAAGVPFTAIEIGPVFDIGTPDGLAAAEFWAGGRPV
jgi:UDP-N-acetylglucosamine diphosphorylase / glucose-1-phosphate thymidylyltransferase / UDP-N-acetylgalactosamine diphosphorylase / glucosamine-1-phosphate N-acetyltransferase / galactosamine-1-phosphate N-acetyltransferase